MNNKQTELANAVMCRLCRKSGHQVGDCPDLPDTDSDNTKLMEADALLKD